MSNSTEQKLPEDPTRGSTKQRLPDKVIGTRSLEKTYHERTAVRVIFTNDKHEIILLHANIDSYYKLPGGGVKPNEAWWEVAEREAEEETGCVIKVNKDQNCLGKVEEWRDGDAKFGPVHQFSYLYAGQLIEDTGKPKLTEKEKAAGLEHVWIGIEEARARFESSKPKSDLGRSIEERDSFLLKLYADSQ